MTDQQLDALIDRQLENYEIFLESLDEQNSKQEIQDAKADMEDI